MSHTACHRSIHVNAKYVSVEAEHAKDKKKKKKKHDTGENFVQANGDGPSTSMIVDEPCKF